MNAGTGWLRRNSFSRSATNEKRGTYASLETPFHMPEGLFIRLGLRLLFLQLLGEIAVVLGDEFLELFLAFSQI